MKAQLRRYTRYNEASAPDLSIDVGNLSICKETHTCTLNGKRVNLTPIEFDILWLLCENRGKVISAEELFEKVWGDKFLDCNNTVMCISAGCGKSSMNPPRNPASLKTVWGVGYKIE